MRTSRILTLFCIVADVLIGVSTWLSAAVLPSAADMNEAQRWAKMLDNLPQSEKSEPFFSFIYDGKPSSELLSGWKKSQTSQKLDDFRTQQTQVWTDPKSGLEVRCVSVAYADYPVIEWTVYLKNTGEKETPILENIQGMDVSLGNEGVGEYVLHNMRGDDCSPSSYEPLEFKLVKDSSHRFAAAGGRPTNGTATPYFNLQWQGQGVICVLGWPGQWAAQFSCDKSSRVSVRGGQELTKLKLLPGEQIRTPLSVLMFWKGDFIGAQNLWRHWMIAHNIPRPGGKLPAPITSICMGLQQSEEGEIKNIHSYIDNGVKQDYWWMDAGWYPCDGNWPKTGTWEPDPARFPHGLKSLSDYVHSKGMKMVVWFEPERVAADTWLTKTHPEWIFGGAQGGLLNFGNPQVRDWAIEHFDKFIKEQGVDLYREDHNIDPLGYWRGNDAPDRQGITENFHVQGHLAYWDELRRRHPDMLMDTCASGGRRNDLESLRRAVPLLRSDYQGAGDPNDIGRHVGNQGHTYGLSLWVPYYGTGEYYNNGYSVRSHFCMGMGVGYNPGLPIEWDKLKKTLADWKTVCWDFYGDYYPLTPYSLSEKEWIAWQFDRPEAGEGMVQAFRRRENAVDSILVKLYALDQDAVYTLTNLDISGTTEMTGRDLCEKGLTIPIKEQPGSAIFKYKKKTQ